MMAVLRRPGSIWSRLAGSVLVGAGLGACAAALGPWAFWPGFWAYTLVLVAGCFGLVSAWRWAGGGRTLAWLVALAFFLRAGTGMAVNLLLPDYGHDSDAENAGYLFYDAYKRDVESWDNSLSMTSVGQVFTAPYDTDQYGGMIIFSVLVYHFLSPDAHRVWLILFFGALAAAMGVPFFWKAVRARWGDRIAGLAGWILVLYPDGIFYSASQMREPFLLGLICLALWALLSWREHPVVSGVVALACTALMATLSTLIAMATVVVIGVWFWLEVLWPRSRAWRWGGFAFMALAAVTMITLRSGWLRQSAWYDLRLTELASGWVKKAVTEVGQQWRVPFMIGYGLAQPVLPAILAYPAEALWKTLGIWRAVGWYALAPLLLYSFYAGWKAKPPELRRLWMLLSAATLAWLLISSARAGGDQWDNPRYRMLFLPWMALLAAWALDYALVHRDAWLARWLVVEAIFLGFFTNWYFSRYFRVWRRLPFWEMVAWIVGLSALVLASGLIWEWVKRWRARRVSR